MEIIELDDDGDGVIGGESGDDFDDSSGNGSEIEVVEDNLKMKGRLVALAKGVLYPKPRILSGSTRNGRNLVGMDFQ